MVERRVNVRVAVSGNDVSREFSEIRNEALGADAAIRAIPNRVRVTADTKGLRDIESDARRAQRSSSALVDTVTILAPAFSTVGAAAVPALAGLSTELGISAAAAGVALLAFNGIGDALKALEAARIDPSAANLKKLDEVMGKLGPDARAFALELDSLRPAVDQLQNGFSARLFPGLTSGLDDLQSRLPEIAAFGDGVAAALGQIGAETGKNLSSDEWDSFFDDLISNGKPILLDTAHTVGDLTGGLARLWQATLPLTRDFTGGLAKAAFDFHDWADQVERTDGAQEFMDYVRTTGPIVWSTLGKIGNALLQVAEAGAPLGGPLLQVLGKFADIIARIADSPIGTPLIAMASGLALINRALAVSALAKNSLIADLLYGKIDTQTSTRGANALVRTQTGLAGISTRARQVNEDVRTMASTYATAGTRSERELTRVSAAQSRLKSNLGPIARNGAVIAGIGIAASGAADGIGLTNTASLALAGTMAGPWGAAIGGGIGLLLDARKAADEAASSQAAYDKVLQGSDPAPIRAKVNELQDRGITRDTPQISHPAAGIRANVGGLDQRAKDADTLTKSYAALDRISQLNNMKVGATNAQLLGSGLRLTAAGEQAVANESVDAAKATAAFDDAMKALNQALSIRSSLTAYKSSLFDVADALKKNGATLDLNTRAGLANESALESVASNAQSRMQELRDAGNTVGEMKFAAKATAELSRVAQGFGMPKRQADALAKSLLDIGETTSTPKIKVNGAPAANAAITNVQNRLTALDGTTATTWIAVKRKGGNPSGDYDAGPRPGMPSARGNYFPATRAFARGDIANAHQPQIAAGQTPYRVWAEPETGGEAYIPLRNDSRRPRARAITEATAAHMGGAVVWMNATGSYTNPVRDQADYNLQLLQQQQTINQINADLAAKVKKGKHKGQLELSGFARQVKLAELQSAQLALQELQAQGVNNDLDTAAQAAQDAADTLTAAADALEQSRTASAGSLYNQVGLFSRGSSSTPQSAVGDINREISLIAQYGKVMASLSGSGAQPALLAQVKAYAEQGDLKGAIRFGNALLAQPLLIGDLNSSLATLDAVSSQVAGYTNGAGFSYTGGGVTTTSNLTIMLAADPSAWLAQVEQYIQHYVPGIVATAMGR